MERWAAPKVTAGSARRYVADQPSFSSTLLDAIYKSMDEQPGHGGGATGVEAVAAAARSSTRRPCTMGTTTSRRSRELLGARAGSARHDVELVGVF
ncbi:hypothetical protein EE612_015626 [Oryza sativa]|nr:hypothetical protein EE612_015626 [Oryza sativa]